MTMDGGRLVPCWAVLDWTDGTSYILLVHLPFPGMDPRRATPRQRQHHTPRAVFRPARRPCLVCPPNPLRRCRRKKNGRKIVMMTVSTLDPATSSLRWAAAPLVRSFAPSPKPARTRVCQLDPRSPPAVPPIKIPRSACRDSWTDELQCRP